MSNKNTQEQAVLTFTKESKDIYKMIANFTPVNSFNNEISVFHKHVLAIAHVFHQDPSLFVLMANYINEGGDMDALRLFLQQQYRKH